MIASKPSNRPIPNLTRSSLHRCFQRRSIERLPDVDGNKTPKNKFQSNPIGYFHIDITEVRTAKGTPHLFVAIDRTRKLAYVELHERVLRATARQFLLNLIKTVPYKLHTVLTVNAAEFTDPKGESWISLDIKQTIAEGRLSGTIPSSVPVR